MTSSFSRLTARAGRWSAAHRRLAIAGWLAFVVLAVVGGGVAGFHQGDDDDGVGSSGRGDRIAAAAFPESPSETVIVQARHGLPATVADVRDRLADAPGVRSVERAQSKPGSRLLIVHYAPGTDIDPIVAATEAAGRAHPDAYVGQFGEDSLDAALSEQIGADMGRAESVSLPITLVLLLLSFGSIVAALLPLGLALSSVAAAMGLVSLISHVVPMEETVNSVVLLVGLAVGVDYSLFYLRREREERAAGRGPDAALRAAAATSGHAVLVSGMTVMIAMAGMFLAGSAIFSALAIGAIIVVAVALLASVSVLPALLSVLGDRVEKGRLPFIGRRRSQGRAWGFVLDRVLRRPVLSAVAAAGLLVALALPALDMKTELPSMKTITSDLPARQAYDRIEATFPGGGFPATVVVRGDRAPVRDAIEALPATTSRVTADGRIAAVEVPMPGDGTGPKADAALRRLRAQAADLPGVRADVTGMTAGSADFAQLMRDRAPLVFGFVLGLAFVLLLATFRSVVIPIKAIALNLLSVGAAYGVLSLAYSEPITAWLPMFLFVILFGLSMDYHVFIVSRIRELRMGGMATRDAVATGIRSTAGVVTSAAAIMVAVFGAFGLVDSLEMQQMGIGLAAAVLIDATVIRAVLLPAAMTLLGEANWWWPGASAGRRRPHAAAVRSAA